MLMKKLKLNLILILLFGINTNAQTNDINLIFGKWKEAEINIDNKIVEIGIRRGGISNIAFNENKTIIYSGSFNCGFGSYKTGIWNYNKLENIINIEYSDIKGYMHNKNVVLTEDNNRQKFKVIRINESELILNYLNEPNKKLYFLKIKN